MKSIAYPAPADLDPSLSSLISSPKQTLTRLAAQDTDAAAMLSAHLSGYATLRRFYDLRDAAIPSSSTSKSTQTATPPLRPKARSRAAASALLILISAAASPIQGGLYDSSVESAVPVDVLLPLLGESLVFLNTPARTLSLQHLYTLLAAVEDFETAGGLVRAQCEEVLRTALGGDADVKSKGKQGGSQSQSALAGSLYSLINSADFSASSSVMAGGGSAEGSGVLVKGGNREGSAPEQRGWDWRAGFPKGAGGKELVRVLRLQVAREVARCFAEGEVGV